MVKVQLDATGERTGELSTGSLLDAHRVLTSVHTIAGFALTTVKDRPFQIATPDSDTGTVVSGAGTTVDQTVSAGTSVRYAVTLLDNSGFVNKPDLWDGAVIAVTEKPVDRPAVHETQTFAQLSRLQVVPPSSAEQLQPGYRLVGYGQTEDATYDDKLQQANMALVAPEFLESQAAFLDPLAQYVQSHLSSQPGLANWQAYSLKPRVYLPYVGFMVSMGSPYALKHEGYDKNAGAMCNGDSGGPLIDSSSEVIGFLRGSFLHKELQPYVGCGVTREGSPRDRTPLEVLRFTPVAPYRYAIDTIMRDCGPQVDANACAAKLEAFVKARRGWIQPETQAMPDSPSQELDVAGALFVMSNALTLEGFHELKVQDVDDQTASAPQRSIAVTPTEKPDFAIRVTQGANQIQSIQVNYVCSTLFGLSSKPAQLTCTVGQATTHNTVCSLNTVSTPVTVQPDCNSGTLQIRVVGKKDAALWEPYKLSVDIF